MMRREQGFSASMAAILAACTGAPSDARHSDGGDHTGPEGCLDGALHGAWLGERPGWSLQLYEDCDGEGYFLERPGSTPVVAYDAVAALKDLVDTLDYLAVPGVVGVGVRRCCEAAAEDAYCIHVDLQTNTTVPIDVIPYLEPLLEPAGDACFGITVTMLGLEGPRCDPDDPTCEPVAYCVAEDDVCCPSASVWTEPLDRVPVTVEHPELAAYNEGVCGDDGECYVNGCGNDCNAWTVPGEFTTCECVTALVESFCGCVDDLCQWFYP